MIWLAFGLGLFALIIDCINFGIAIEEEDDEKFIRNGIWSLIMIGCIIFDVLRIGGVI